MKQAFSCCVLTVIFAFGPAAAAWGQALPTDPISNPLVDAPTIAPIPLLTPELAPPAPKPHPLLRRIAHYKPREFSVGPDNDEPQAEPGDGSAAMILLGPPAPRATEWFHRRQWSVQYLTGVLFTPYHFGIRMGHQIPMNFLMENVRFNWVARGYGADRLFGGTDRLFRGSTEIGLEIHNMPIVAGPGHIVTGASAYIRYNFGFTSLRRWVLYYQAGGGGMYSDSYLYQPSKLVSGFNFIVQFAGGVHYFLSPRLSLDSEATFYHYSNGGIVLPNVSINGTNAFFGLTYYFGRR